MNALESPLEALAINYVRFAFLAVAGNLWAWLTIVTAALSFWRIRTTSRSVAKLLFPPQEATPAAAVTSVSPSPAVLATVVSESCVTKGRFTMCFEWDNATEEEEQEQEEAVEGSTEVGGGGEWWSGWEKMLRERSGEVCWYSCQDLSVLDGRVVRLWDDHRRLGRQ